MMMSYGIGDQSIGVIVHDCGLFLIKSYVMKKTWNILITPLGRAYWLPLKVPSREMWFDYTPC